MGRIATVSRRIVVAVLFLIPLVAFRGSAWGQEEPTEPLMSVDQAIEGLNSPKALDQENAMRAIVKMGPKARATVPTIVKIMEEEIPYVSTGLVHALIAIGPDACEAVPVLIKTAGSQNFHMRYLSCRALGKMGDAAKPAVPILIKSLTDRVTSVRRRAAEALGRLGDKVAPDAVQPLIKATGDPIDPVREEAVRALGNFGELATPAIPTLKTAAFSKSSTVRPHAAMALWKLTKDAELLLPLLNELLHDGDLEWEAARVLAAMGEAAAPAVPNLIAAIETGDASIQIFAAEALGQIGPKAKSALPALRKLLKHEEPSIRKLAEQVIKQIER